MNNITIVLTAAKKVKVAGSLLLAICTYESNGLKSVVNPFDNGSPSFGICQIKYETAQMVGYTGTRKGLMKPYTNAYFAAKYLAYQQKRYGSEDWCKLTAAYNAGTYHPSKKRPGQPTNITYVRRVQKKLQEPLKYRLSCDIKKEKETNYDFKTSKTNKKNVEQTSCGATCPFGSSKLIENSVFSTPRLSFEGRL